MLLFVKKANTFRLDCQVRAVRSWNRFYSALPVVEAVFIVPVAGLVPNTYVRGEASIEA